MHRPGMLYVERDELLYREIGFHILDDAGAEYDYVKRGYWVNPQTELAQNLANQRVRFLTDWTQARY